MSKITLIPDMLTKKDIIETIQGKTVALLGSAPSVVYNQADRLNKFNYIVRINNYKIKNLENQVGTRTDIYYSYFGNAIRKRREDFEREGVRFFMCKCPNCYCHESGDKINNIGGDFKWIYDKRFAEKYFYKPVYIPELDTYMKVFTMLDGHVPTTGFMAIMEFISCNPALLHITGFDFFESKMHNINEPWKEKNFDDPVRHRPDLEKQILKRLWFENTFITLDKTIQRSLGIENKSREELAGEKIEVSGK